MFNSNKNYNYSPLDEQHESFLLFKELVDSSAKEKDRTAYWSNINEVLHRVQQLQKKPETLAPDVTQNVRQFPFSLENNNLQKIEGLLGHEADFELKTLVQKANPEDLQNAIEAFQEALEEDRVAIPVRYIKAALRDKWSPNYKKINN